MLRALLVFVGQVVLGLLIAGPVLGIIVPSFPGIGPTGTFLIAGLCIAATVIVPRVLKRRRRQRR